MRDQICLLTTGQLSLQGLPPMLVKAGLSVWEAGSVQDCLTDSRLAQTLCVIASFATLRDIDRLADLRIAGFDEPIILISNCALSAGVSARAHLLDVLPHPFEPRDVLTWIECICIANLAAAGRLKRAA